jgi:hypothetical protein
MKKILIATTFLMSLGIAGALADDGFDPAHVILANASDQPMTGTPYVSEQEAKLWVLNAGYNQVSGLTRDQHALYHGTALLDGETYDIVVDTQGNIVGAKE